VAESLTPPDPDEVFKSSTVHHRWEDLLQLGGFPEPLLAASEQKAKRWSRLRMERLLREDLRDLRAVGDLQAVQVLAELLPNRVGSLLSVRSLQEDVGVAYATVRAWLIAFEALYICFRIRPYAKRIRRALKAEPKLYLFDPLQIPQKEVGARTENLVALHLKKACDYWTDAAFGEFELRFVRDKEQREVDFLVLRDKEPWMMVECKSGETTPSPSLLRFGELLRPPWRFQLVADSNFDRELPHHHLRIVGYEKFLAGLV
jgi:predicted AAA+ superfamily ATPase